MKVIYLIQDNNSTRIPFYGNDRGLHELFTVKGGGLWNPIENEFVFNRKLDSNKLAVYLPDCAIVQIGHNNDGTISCASESSACPSKTKTITETIETAVIPENQNNEINYFTGQWVEKLEIEMRARKYSGNTRDLYLHYNQNICNWVKKSPDQISSDDIKRYLAYKEKHEKMSASTLNIALSSFKFLHRNILKSDRVREQKRPRQDKRLPIVLSKTEIKRMFDLERNLKHRLLLMLVYSSGLRVSEVVSLKCCDLDTVRKTLMVIAGKGRKDRYSIMSSIAIKELEEYNARYEPTGWLFPGQPESTHIHIRTAQHIFQKALKRAGLQKKASIHCLRHSFATHLLENGYDITYIRDLLGHNSIRTTERYTHVARKKALNIVSPLDTIDTEE